MQQYPFLYALDEVELVYDDSARTYQISYHRVVKNLGREPLVSLPLTIFVCVFPGDLELARQYYRLHPLRFEHLQFVAQDDSGAMLTPHITLANDSYLEFDLLLQEAQTGRPLPVYPGKTRELFYRYCLSDEMWGPFLKKGNRIACEQMKVTLRFPPGLVDVWGQQCSPTGSHKPIMPPLQAELAAPEEIHRWALAPTEFLTRYKFYWRFKDERGGQFEARVRGELGAGGAGNDPRLSHSPDFRSVRWYHQPYQFTPVQAACVEILWQAWTNHTPEVGQAYLLEAIGTKAQRVADLFKKHPAWGTLIVTGTTKGTLRLQPPEPDQTAP